MEHRVLVGGQSIPLTVQTDKVAVRYREPSPLSARADFASRTGARFEQRLEVPGEKYTIIPVDPASAHGMHEAASTADSGVARAAPVFRYGEMDVLATDRVMLRLANAADPIQSVLSGVRTVETLSRGHGEYVVRLAEDLDPLEVSNMLATRPGVAYAEPDFVNIGTRLQRGALRPQHRSPVTRFSETIFAAMDASTQQQGQYALALISADKAWTVTQGATSVVIAVLDEGVDTTHKDLGPGIVASFDAVDGDTFQEPNPWDGHGTACAGLAAARPSGVGVTGVAPGCKLMALRIAQSAQPAGPWVWSNDQAATAIDWAWQHGAAVLSNSWGGGIPSNRIAGAIERAVTLGRQGKGCVVVAAAGNRPTAVGFPANLPTVIAVSATNEFDEFKTPNSSDGENWWGSSFGPEVGLAAPGVHHLTCDIRGAGGYSKGDYYAAFNGTSSSTPLVAGAAALVISARPDLSAASIRTALLDGADKVGSEPYVDGRNDSFGAGRLNVYAAVQAALAMPT
jgi:thermitase